MIKNMKVKKSRALTLPGLILVLVMMLAGCGGSKEESKATTAVRVDGETLIESYVEAYEAVDYRRMWACWPAEAFGGKVNILADMKKDIFRNYYSSKASLKLECDEITVGDEEDSKRIKGYFSIADITYVTDVYRMPYKAVVTGGKRDGETYREGTIFAFRNHGKWYVYDD